MKQEMSQNRFDAGYTIPNNAYYDQSAWTGFDGKPGSNTYWGVEMSLTNMLDLTIHTLVKVTTVVTLVHAESEVNLDICKDSVGLSTKLNL